MSAPIRLSAAVIALNEESKITDCLDSLAFCDEIVLVDSGSTDETLSIARSRGARIFHNAWPGYVKQKNFAIDQCRGEWILSLDADERVSERLRSSIISALREENPKVDGYSIARLVWYIDRWIYHAWYPSRRVRLFRRSKARWGGVDPHDRIEIDGAIARLDGDIYHLSFDDISAHLETIRRFSSIGAGELLAGDRRDSIRLRFPLLNGFARGSIVFLKSYFARRGFLDGAPGLIIAVLSAYDVLVRYRRLALLLVADSQAESAD